MIIITVTCLVSLIVAVLIAAYHFILLAVTFLRKSDFQQGPVSRYHSFAIIIPAHNEEQVIMHTLKSCKGLEYPEDKYRIIVIADNCTDKTADLVRSYGCECLERFDEKDRGKGFALTWAFERVLSNDFDAVLVLDADCLIERQSLQIFNAHLNKGMKVLQANYIASNPNDSSQSYVFAVGNYLENQFFYRPKSKLGLAVFLRGTGMVFARDVLERYPWKAHSIVEDVEYAVMLLREGIPISFVDKAKVYTQFPSSDEQMVVQRKRWASGNLSYGKKNAFSLILEGIRKKHFILFDAGITFLLLSRPLIILESIIALSSALIRLALIKDTISRKLVLWSGSIVLFWLGYFIMGIIRIGINKHRIKLILKTPIVVLKLIRISLLGVAGQGKDDWNKTPR